MQKLFQKVLFPGRCIVCHRILKEPDRKKVCPQCEEKIQPVTEPRCKRCSRPVDDMETEYCGDCEDRVFHVEKGYALYPYDKTVKRAVWNFKYGGELSAGEFFAGEMVRHYGAWVSRLMPDAIVPVPVHRNRKRFRGFNQAEFLAARIGWQLGISVLPDYLERTEDTKPQKNLGLHERIQNLKKGFCVREPDDKNAVILLVDDIYTTGATLEACAIALKEAGARQIYFLCLCIGI